MNSVIELSFKTREMNQARELRPELPQVKLGLPREIEGNMLVPVLDGEKYLKSNSLSRVIFLRFLVCVLAYIKVTSLASYI